VVENNVSIVSCVDCEQHLHSEISLKISAKFYQRWPAILKIQTKTNLFKVQKTIRLRDIVEFGRLY